MDRETGATGPQVVVTDAAAVEFDDQPPKARDALGSLHGAGFPASDDPMDQGRATALEPHPDRAATANAMGDEGHTKEKRLG